MRKVTQLFAEAEEVLKAIEAEALPVNLTQKELKLLAEQHEKLVQQKREFLQRLVGIAEKFGINCVETEDFNFPFPKKSFDRGTIWLKKRELKPQSSDQPGIITMLKYGPPGLYVSICRAVICEVEARSRLAQEAIEEFSSIMRKMAKA